MGVIPAGVIQVVTQAPSVHFDCNSDTQVRFHEDCVNLPRRLCRRVRQYNLITKRKILVL